MRAKPALSVRRKSQTGVALISTRTHWHGFAIIEEKIPLAEHSVND
jgi:hypothetical protein